MYKKMMDRVWSKLPNMEDPNISIDQVINFWRTAALNNFLFIAMIICFPVVSYVVITELNRGQTLPGVIFTIVYLFMVTLTAARKLSTQFRAYMLFGILYLTAVIATARSGLAGDGRVYYAILPIFAVPLLGRNAAIRLSLLCFSTYFFFAFRAESGQLAQSLIFTDNPLSFSEWSYAGIVMIALSTTTLFLTYILFQFLVKTLRTERDIRRKLAFANESLNNKNIILEEINLQRQLLTQQLISIEEQERTNLAHNLHDEVLSDLAIISLDLGKSNSPEAIQQHIQNINNRIRKTINRLRSPMLNFGLQAGLQGLVDYLEDRLPEGASLVLDVPAIDHRFDSQTEQHLYRIIQQAAENAVSHAQATRTTISGEISGERVEITISDNGKGFDLTSGLKLSDLLLKGHFGLSNMIERAEMIGAKITLESEIGQGTVISLS
ncbi:MAG: ATP-binding protein, partial [Anaerolineae bacterium]|nr:ATP-binding protein [Anaerolineae bacterium]